MLNEVQSSQQSPSTAFYITGGTLRGDAACYVRRQADESLFESLSQGQFCYVLTSRQMGKSSLMIRTAERLRESGTGVVILDLTAVGQNLTAEQWYDGLLNRIGRQLQLEDELESFWLANPRLGPLQRWMNAITEVVLPRYPGKLVIFIDEIDTVRSLPFTTDEFFAGIREFYNRRTSEPELERLTFCLLGVASPSDLIRDTRMTPFNIGRRIELNDFTEDEAAPLAQGLGRDESMGADLLKRVLYWTGGHPYLTQRLCLAVAKDDSVIDAKGVDNKCEELFFTRRAQDGDDNLVFVRERILRSDVELAGLLTMYDQVHSGKRIADDETSPLVSALHLSGITRVENSRLKVRNQIYDRVFDREWVKEHMPDAELRRQQAAYRKGLMRAAAVAIAIVLALSTLAIIAFNQRNIAKAEAERADQNFRKATSSDEEARKALSIAEQQRNVAINQQTIAEEQRILADQQRLRAENQEETNRQQLYAAQMNLAMQAWEDAGITRLIDLLDYQLPKPGQRDLRGFEWYFLRGLANNELRSFRNARVAAPSLEYSESAVAFFPDNRRLVNSGSDSIIKIWDIITGNQLMNLKGHHKPVWSVDISPNGHLIASSGEDPFIKIWDAQSGKEVRTLTGHSLSVYKVAFSPDGSSLASAGKDNTCRIWDVKSGRNSINLIHPSIVSTVEYSPDGKMIVTGCQDHQLRLWDALTGKELREIKAHSASVFSVAFSPDGKLLASSGGELEVRFWDVATGNRATMRASGAPTGLRQMGIYFGGGVLSIAFSPDGARLAVASSDRTVRIYSTTTLQQLNTFKGHGLAVDSVSFSANGKIIASSGKDGITKLWDIAAKQEPDIIDNLTVVCMSFSPDDRYLAVSNPNGSIVKLWDVRSGIRLRTFEGHEDGIYAVEFSSDGKKIATSSVDTTARIWDVVSGKVMFTLRGHGKTIRTLSISPDSRFLATGSNDKTIRLWDFISGRELYVFYGHNSDITSVTFSPDGRQLATASEDREVKIWDVNSKRLIMSLPHPGRVGKIAYSPDNRIFAAATADGQVQFWDLSRRKVIKTLKGHHESIENMVFFPDGSRLATGSYDRTVKIWDVATGQELLSRKYLQMIFALAVSHGGKTLASATIGGRISLWHAGESSNSHNYPIRKLNDLISPLPSPINRIPPGWNPAVPSVNDYEIGIDEKHAHTGKASVYIKSITQAPANTASLRQALKADLFRGKRIRLSGFLKSQLIQQAATLYVQVDGTGFTINIDNMATRRVRGTTEWKKHDIVIDIPTDCLMIEFGLLFSGAGQIWVDDLRFDVVDSIIPLTGLRNFEDMYRRAFQSLDPAERKRREDEYRARAKDLPLAPVNLDFEGMRK